MLRSYLFAGVVIALIGSHFYTYQRGYRNGFNAANTAHQIELAKAQEIIVANAELASRKEELRLIAEAERDALAQKLVESAYAESVSHPACLPASRVRRLNGL